MADEPKCDNCYFEFEGHRIEGEGQLPDGTPCPECNLGKDQQQLKEIICQDQ